MSPGTSAEEIANALPGERRLYYEGGWRDSVGGHTFEVTNPADGSSLGNVHEARKEDIDRAVSAAANAQPAWQALPPVERAALLRKLAALVREHTDELALLDAADCGNPRTAMLGDLRTGAYFLDYFAGLATEAKGTVLPTSGNQLNYVRREPLGVVARIIPFNHPAMFVCAKMAAPLAAGNCVLMKPSEQTPLSALRLAEIFDHVLPPSVFSVVNGGVAAGEALATNEQVDAITLVGSTRTGRAVSVAAGQTLKKTLLELGGKNGLIVFPDADLAKAAKSVVDGMNFGWTAGQSCGSTSRVFVHESVYNRVVSSVVEQVDRLRPGIPTDLATEMGCLTGSRQFDKVMKYIEIGKEEGARLVSGGSRPRDPELADGYFVLPTVFADVQPTMRIAREEIFGPVLSILKWSDPEELIANMNGLEFGLTASVWTRNLDIAHETAGKLKAGYVWINGSSAHIPGAPFGGFKQSGMGREESIEELMEFTHLKNVNVSLSR